MTEFEIFALNSSMNSSSTGAYQIAMAFSIWVAFRAANLTGQQYADNIIAKTAATVFGLATLFYFNMTYAFWSFNQAATSYRLAELKDLEVTFRLWHLPSLPRQAPPQPHQRSRWFRVTPLLLPLNLQF